MVDVVNRMIGAYRKEYERRPVPTLFLTILIAFFIIFVTAALITGGDTLYNVLNSDKSRFFGDYFESIVDSYYDPYTYGNVIYPPLIVTLYAVQAHFIIPFVRIPSGGTLTPELIRSSQMGIMVFMIITLVTFYALYVIYSRLVKDADIRKELTFFFTILLAYPFVYAVERGNSIILALVFCFIFIMGYRSENRFVRYASYIALGIAAGIKIYPLILWLLIVRNREYREAAVCAVIIAALLFIPFVFTDGGPLTFIDNFLIHSESRLGFTNITQITTGLLHEICGLPDNGVTILSYIILGLFTLLSFIIILFDKEMKFWKVLALVGCNLVLGLGSGVQYQTIYLMPAMLYFLIAEKKMTKENLFYVVCFAMMMVLIPGIEISGAISTSAGDVGFYPSAVIGAMESAFVIIMAVALLREGLMRIYRSRSAERREHAAEV
ncbi:MAG: glycosyltransferase 87 family protein [Methanomassiliicoccaceae archaeon]|nr:glycosyltransferase 87 family protein [Methanomassiliicoccaceae archaeon]